MEQRAQKIACYAVVALFLAALWLPMLEGRLDLDTYPTPFERRALAEKPVIPHEFADFATLPAAVDAYVNDHFGLRNLLIQWNSRLYARRLGVSHSPQILLGKKNWIYLADEPVMDSYRVRKPWTGDKLASVKKETELRAAWCSKRGIQYLDSWLPEKQALYPEYLPGWVQPIHAQSNLDLFLTAMSQTSEISVLDLGAALTRAKQETHIFYSGDSHWNSQGAYAAYRALLEKMRLMGVRGRVLLAEEMQQERIVKQGDISQMLNLEAYYQEDAILLKPRVHRSQRAAFEASGYELPPNSEIHAFDNENQKLPKLVMFADSFGYEILPFLAESFSRVVYVRRPNFDSRIVAQEQPAVVLELHAARQLELERPRGWSVLKE